MTLTVTPHLEWPLLQSVDAHRVLEGEPKTRTVSIYKDNRAHAGLWQVTPGKFSTAHLGFVEAVTILDGTGRLVRDTGETTELSPGVFVVLEDGWTGCWVIDSDLTKSFVIVPTA